MVVMTTTARNRQARGEPFVRADLDLMPDDGRRYELIDGSLVVTPAPSLRHQVVAGQLHLRLAAACPQELLVLFAPFDVTLDDRSVLQPDLLVAPRSAFTAGDLPAAPLLVVEVLSPSTRHIDLGLKKSRYETAGTPAYWVVDPAGPSITVWHLVDGVYVEQGRASGDEELTLDRPFPVTVRPRDLIDA